MQPQEDNVGYIQVYDELLRSHPEVHALLAPVDAERAMHVVTELAEKIKEDGVKPKPILVSSSVFEMFNASYPYVWAVDQPAHRLRRDRGLPKVA